MLLCECRRGHELRSFQTPFQPGSNSAPYKYCRSRRPEIDISEAVKNAVNSQLPTPNSQNFERFGSWELTLEVDIDFFTGFQLCADGVGVVAVSTGATVTRGVTGITPRSGGRRDRPGWP